MGPRLTRRRFIGGVGVGAAAVTAGAVIRGRSDKDVGSPVHRLQLGVASPTRPLPFLDLAIIDVGASGSDLTAELDALGVAAQRLTREVDEQSLTVVLGVGPRVIAAAGSDGGLDVDLPVFTSDAMIRDRFRGGDLCIQSCAAHASVARATTTELARSLTDASIRWRQTGWRDQGSGTVAVNPLGFADGIAVPRTRGELAEHVVIDDHPARFGATIMVLRRIRLDTTAFAALDIDRQARIIGRHRDGSPISGGGPNADVDLRKKHADGRLLIPLDSHVRAAHPSTTGSHLMLRRSYGYDDGEDQGLVFICYQKDVRTFVATQRRVDDVDALTRFMTPTASAAFAVPPALGRGRLLGDAVRDLTTAT